MPNNISATRTSPTGTRQPTQEATPKVDTKPRPGDSSALKKLKAKHKYYVKTGQDAKAQKVLGRIAGMDSGAIAANRAKGENSLALARNKRDGARTDKQALKQARRDAPTEDKFEAKMAHRDAKLDQKAAQKEVDGLHKSMRHDEMGVMLNKHGKAWKANKAAGYAQLGATMLNQAIGSDHGAAIAGAGGEIAAKGLGKGFAGIARSMGGDAKTQAKAQLAGEIVGRLGAAAAGLVIGGMIRLLSALDQKNDMLGGLPAQLKQFTGQQAARLGALAGNSNDSAADFRQKAMGMLEGAESGQEIQNQRMANKQVLAHHELSQSMEESGIDEPSQQAAVSALHSMATNGSDITAKTFEETVALPVDALQSRISAPGNGLNGTQMAAAQGALNKATGPLNAESFRALIPGDSADAVMEKVFAPEVKKLSSALFPDPEASRQTGALREKVNGGASGLNSDQRKAANDALDSNARKETPEAKLDPDQFSGLLPASLPEADRTAVMNQLFPMLGPAENYADQCLSSLDTMGALPENPSVLTPDEAGKFADAGMRFLDQAASLAPGDGKEIRNLGKQSAEDLRGTAVEIAASVIERSTPAVGTNSSTPLTPPPPPPAPHASSATGVVDEPGAAIQGVAPEGNPPGGINLEKADEPPPPYEEAMRSTPASAAESVAAGIGSTLGKIVGGVAGTTAGKAASQLSDSGSLPSTRPLGTPGDTGSGST